MADPVPEKKQNAKGKVQPSGYQGDNPATAGPGETGVSSGTPENRDGQINPSAPNSSTHQSGDTVLRNGEGLGSVGYGGENKPMSQPDGTAADLDETEIINDKSDPNDRSR